MRTVLADMAANQTMSLVDLLARVEAIKERPVRPGVVAAQLYVYQTLGFVKAHSVTSGVVQSFTRTDSEVPVS